MAKKQEPPYVPYQPNYSLEQFMACEGMSRPFLNELRELGLINPIQWGGWIKITHEERLRFHERLENLTPEQKAHLEAAKARHSARGRKAAEASVASERHISVSAATKAKRKREPAS
jgi:hypothetical protein